MNGKRKAEPGEADSPRKKSCAIADSPKVRLATLPWVRLSVKTLLLMRDPCLIMLGALVVVLGVYIKRQERQCGQAPRAVACGGTCHVMELNYTLPL